MVFAWRPKPENRWLPLGFYLFLFLLNPQYMMCLEAIGTYIEKIFDWLVQIFGKGIISEIFNL